MTSTTTLSRRLDSLATLVERTITDAAPKVATRRVEFAEFVADELREGAKNFVFALRDAVEVLAPSEGGDSNA